MPHYETQPGSCMEDELVGEGNRERSDRADEMVTRRDEGGGPGRTTGKQMDGLGN